MREDSCINILLVRHKTKWLNHDFALNRRTVFKGTIRNWFLNRREFDSERQTSFPTKNTQNKKPSTFYTIWCLLYYCSMQRYMFCILLWSFLDSICDYVLLLYLLRKLLSTEQKRMSLLITLCSATFCASPVGPNRHVTHFTTRAQAALLKAISQG